MGNWNEYGTYPSVLMFIRTRVSVVVLLSLYLHIDSVREPPPEGRLQVATCSVARPRPASNDVDTSADTRHVCTCCWV